MSSAGRKSPAGLTDSELRAWRAVIETTALLRHRLDTLLMADSGLSGSDYPILVALHESQHRQLRASELASRIGWERSRLSHQLGRMERRDLLRRTTDPHDNRGSNVRLTEHGERTYLRATVAHSDAVRANFVDALTDPQLHQLDDIMHTLARHLEA
jgi:DNA-binding MarR family transcriptional regulator